MKNLVASTFIVVCIIQWLIPAKMIRDCEQTLTNGTVYKFHIANVYPGQYGEGEYVQINYKEVSMTVDSSEQWERYQPVNIVLGKDENGMAYVTDILTNKPKNKEDYLKSRILQINREADKKILYFDISNNLYYLNPAKLKALNLTDTINFEDPQPDLQAVLAVQSGKALIKDIIRGNNAE